jgi:hypothetical protein
VRNRNTQRSPFENGQGTQHIDPSLTSNFRDLNYIETKEDETTRNANDLLEQRGSSFSRKSRRSILNVTKESQSNPNRSRGPEAEIEKGGEDIHQHMESRLPTPDQAHYLSQEADATALSIKSVELVRTKSREDPSWRPETQEIDGEGQ